MQTFLPYADPEASARVLDVKRLGKQRVECLQVVRGLTVPGYGWRRHPAVTMWTRCLEALARYSLTCCEVWVEAGREDTVASTLRADLAAGGVTEVRSQAELEAAGAVPWWWGHELVHRSHRSHSCARTRRSTARPSPASRPTWPTSGRVLNRGRSPRPRAPRSSGDRVADAHSVVPSPVSSTSGLP